LEGCQHFWIGGVTPAQDFERWYTRGATTLPSRLLRDGEAFPHVACCATTVCAVDTTVSSVVALVPEPPSPPPPVGRGHHGPGLHEVELGGWCFLLTTPAALSLPLAHPHGRSQER
jgi:hypothetical protein